MNFFNCNIIWLYCKTTLFFPQLLYYSYFPPDLQKMQFKIFPITWFWKSHGFPMIRPSGIGTKQVDHPTLVTSHLSDNNLALLYDEIGCWMNNCPTTKLWWDIRSYKYKYLHLQYTTLAQPPELMVKFYDGFYSTIDLGDPLFCRVTDDYCSLRWCHCIPV